MQKKPTKEAQIELAEKIREFIINKWKNLKRGSEILQTSNTALSMILNGKRQPTKQLILKLIHSGFDEENFNKYYMSRDEPNLDNLSKREILELVNQQRFLIYQYQDMVRMLNLQLDKNAKVN